jgi:hypothetical protein
MTLPGVLLDILLAATSALLGMRMLAILQRALVKAAGATTAPLRETGS